jgi:serine/threonine protein kinase
MDKNQFIMVSEWMANGNINEFIKSNRDIDRFELVRSLLPLATPFADDPLRQLKDVTRGLIYMHDQSMIHGDLKGVCI